MLLNESIITRTSVREFSDQKVDHEIIEKILESAKWAPSACNLQLTEYLVIDQDEIRLDLLNKVTKKLSWAPVFIVVIFDKRFSQKRSAAFTSMGMAVENILLTAHDLGLGTCPMTGFSGDKYIRHKLKIPNFYEIALLIALGYPKNNIKKGKERINSNELVHWNQFNKLTPLNDSLSLDEWTTADIINYRRRLAPVYLYQGKNRLGVFNSSIYNKAYNTFLSCYDKKEVKMSVLDLISYDGKFISLLDKNIFLPIASDYLDYTLNILKQKNDFRIAKITNDNNIPLHNNSVDIETCIHKFEFTPKDHIQKIIKEAYRIIKPGGFIFITTANESRFKIILRQILKFYFKIFTKETVNVYENNPFFKIGAFKQRSSGFIKLSLKSAGFKHKAIGKVKVKQGGRFSHHCFNWYLYSK